MELEEAQDKIEDFDRTRGWENSWHLKDLSLNLVEEVGELWNLIKWIDEEEQKEVVEENKPEVSDFVGDALFLILKIANKTDVDCGEALTNTLSEYRERMPSDEIKEAGHANVNSNGVDRK